MSIPRVSNSTPPVKPEPDLSKIGLDLANAAYVAMHGLKGSVYCGHTVGSLKRALDALQLRDDDILTSVELGVVQHGTGYIVADRDEFGAVEIREVVR